MEHHPKYEAIGRFIYGFQRQQPLVDELLCALKVDLRGATVLHEKLTGLEDALAQVAVPEERHAAIDAFLRQMRQMEAMNITLNAFADMSDEQAGHYAEQAATGNALADAVRVSLQIPLAHQPTQCQVPPR